MSIPQNEKLILNQHSHYVAHCRDNEHPTYESRPKPFSRRRRALILIFTVVLPFYLLISFFGISTSETTTETLAEGGAVRHPHSPGPQVAINSHSDRSSLVPLEVHIMSKCPDARDCLRDLVVPAMESISDQVDFRLSFIGRYVRMSISSSMLGPFVCCCHSVFHKFN